ncbi:cytochrome P450 [Pseudovirgaria hyperparasitica]|uniref:Cytochrome P450 n=1 Tax=Pseudovirgaria hyperparasitica TaxID=470096 RepID=A0A6A6VW36_9PEZI|nr:cytochrome P450 [Pseudovirgaria hyperparasitica]KAF2754375.1 cytochrome P450 [Pseudovirgaria hyperparasitica]
MMELPLSIPTLWAALGLGALYYLAYSLLTSTTPVPAELPWLGKPPGVRLFGDIRLRLDGFRNARAYLADGYANYHQKGRSYVYRTLFGTPEIVVPRAQLKWLLDFPDDVASVSEAHRQSLNADYTFPNPILIKECFHEHVIHKNLARKLPALLPATWDETRQAFDDTWGRDTTAWKEICVYENALDVIARLSNRVFLGLPLCREKPLLDAMCAFANAVFRSTMLMNLCPGVLRPLLGPLVCLPNYIHYRKTTKWTIPFIKRRLATLASSDHPDAEKPNDFVQWYIDTARAEHRTKELDPRLLAQYLTPLNFAAIHTTTFTITNLLFDILAPSPTCPADDTLATITDEITHVYRTDCPDGIWTKQSLNRLVRTDSAIRESMRIRNFLTTGVVRKILAPLGVRNEVEGWTAPQGAFVAVDVNSVHHDPGVYARPDVFDAFRFSRVREGAGGLGGEDGGGGGGGGGGDRERGRADVLAGKNLSMVSTSDVFLPFGHGRHACPGRFFVTHELKMYIAYVVMNYEIERLPERPANTWIGPTVLPPMKATIRVRRRA